MSTTERPAKGARLNVRLAPAQADLIRRAAESENTSVSDFVVSSSTEAAEQVLSDRRWFALDASAWEAFQQLLERPAVFKPRLAALLARDDIFSD